MDRLSRSFRRKYCIAVALTLGTAWAIRGQFGHEYGAAWAGAIGMLSIIVLSGRKDWYSRLPAMVALSAIAWGAGGIMSYGMVVGYGRSDSFPNVWYGLSMLFVIGGLYGIIGGGLSALTLETSRERKADWASLITQMVAGGFLFWGILIYQFGYLMTPPRSELWAASLGASCALLWFLYRNQYRSSLRVALWAMLGAGFGFASGNFLQTLGSLSGIDFNWWNVMEYSIGFWGGLGMAYGIVVGQWPEKPEADLRWSNLAGIGLLAILLPWINVAETFPRDKFLKLGESLGYSDPAQFAALHQGLAWGISLFMAIGLISLFIYFYNPRTRVFRSIPAARKAAMIFFLYFLWFMLLSNLVGGTWLAGRFTSQHLYWVNLAAIILLIRGIVRAEKPQGGLNDGAKWYRPVFLAAMLILLSIIVMSLISANIHQGLPGMEYRF